MTEILSKPDHGDMLIEGSKASQRFQLYLDDIEQQINIFTLDSFTVATLPSASERPNGMIMVSDETGGIVPAFSDGTNWLRVTDRAVS